VTWEHLTLDEKTFLLALLNVYNSLGPAGTIEVQKRRGVSPQVAIIHKEVALRPRPVIE